MSEANFTVVQPEQMQALRLARDELKVLAEDSERTNHMDSGDALEAMGNAYDAIDALFVPVKPVVETYRIVVCIDVDAPDLEGAYRAVYDNLSVLPETMAWESSDEWYAGDGQRIEQDAQDLARATVLQAKDDEAEVEPRKPFAIVIESACVNGEEQTFRFNTRAEVAAFHDGLLKGAKIKEWEVVYTDEESE